MRAVALGVNNRWALTIVLGSRNAPCLALTRAERLVDRRRLQNRGSSRLSYVPVPVSLRGVPYDLSREQFDAGLVVRGIREPDQEVAQPLCDIGSKAIDDLVGRPG